eukprot:Gregarina_sp_Poly_1__1378@NODE_1341_length_4343_cov_180_690131_g429_i1_p1_GENE_NODE_1341_length_4343_cov_180_690131_g429_i1NODE_1341_length_4343_cov_180_690131_g429_i1_p1_ORF_typecomplete_len665_score99_86DUF4980/PF16352_5/1_5e04DUF4980/PF16352_5/0_53_NODE_1341_length_4343_cov_180_690131_g429_i120144008
MRTNMPPSPWTRFDSDHSNPQNFWPQRRISAAPSPRPHRAVHSSVRNPVLIGSPPLVSAPPLLSPQQMEHLRYFRGIHRQEPNWIDPMGGAYDEFGGRLSSHYLPTSPGRPNYVYAPPHQPLRPIIYRANNSIPEHWSPQPYPAPYTHPASSYTHPSPYTPLSAPHGTTAHSFVRAPLMQPSVFPHSTILERGRPPARKKKALTYSQCEILTPNSPVSAPARRQVSMQTGVSIGREATAGLPRSASMSGIGSMPRTNSRPLPGDTRQLPGDAHPQSGDRFAPLPSDSMFFDGSINSLEQLKAINEQNLSLARNAHVKDIWKTLQDPVSPSAAPRLQIADVDKARETLKILNPGIQNSEALVQLLLDHIQGKQVQVDDALLAELGAAQGVSQVYLPVSPERAANLPPKPPATETETPSGQSGFKVSHAFAMKLKQGEEREFAAVKVIESPEVLVVFNLITEAEAEDIISLCQGRFQPPQTSAMKIRVEEKQMSYTVPNDLGDIAGVPILDSATLSRKGLTARICLQQYEESSVWSFLKSVTLRAAAVAKVAASKVDSFYVEKYDPQEGAFGLHPSNKRHGLVYICLSTVAQTEGCGISFPAAEIELTPRTGMAIFIPACHADTIPGAPGCVEDHLYVPDIRTEFCINQNETSDKPIYFAVVPIPF